MTKLKQPVKKICEYCGKEFEAGKTTTKCCSDYCSKRAYKETKRKKALELVGNFTIQKKADRVKKDLSNRQGYSIADTATLLGKSRMTIYRYVVSGKIKAKRVSSKFTIIPKKSIDEFLEVTTPYEPLPAKERKPIAEWYTLEEITEKYGIKYRRLRDIVNKERIPEKKDGKITLIAKNKIDNYFRKQGYDEAVINLSEWLTLPDVIKQYNMTENAAYSFLSENHIPKKQQSGKRHYSKWHIDKIKYKMQ